MNLVVLAALWAVGAGDSPDQYHDFRGTPLPAGFRVLGDPEGKLVSSAPEGLRLTLPKDRKRLDRVILSLPVKVRGDFEITATFDIHKADAPGKGFGVGVLLSVNQKARLGRLVRAEGEQVMLWDRWAVVDGKKQLTGEAFRCHAASGRLRLKRVGDVLHFQWSAAKAGEAFHELSQCVFGGDDITEVRLVGDTGRQRCTLEACFADLRIRAANAEARADESVAPGSRLWRLGAVGGLVLVVCAGAFVYIRQRRGAGRAGAASSAATLVEEAGLSLPCPMCGKKLKVKAELAGKKIKCPHCGGALQAPGAVSSP